MAALTVATTATLNRLTTTTNPTVAFTTPENYANRLSKLLSHNSLNPLWCPTISTTLTPQTLSSLSYSISPPSFSLLSAIAFPSRSSISAFSTATTNVSTPLLPPLGDEFTVAALGKDAELINTEFLLKLCSNLNRIRVLVPSIATPSGLVQSLGNGYGRRVLCPVPRVIGIEEPPVVPNFLKELEASGWVPVRVDAYETRWSGPRCAAAIVERESLEALIVTSTGEVEGLLKSLETFGWDWKMVRKRWPQLLVAAHGPVTASGAERLGVDVDVVSERFASFEGVVEAVCKRLSGL